MDEKLPNGWNDWADDAGLESLALYPTEREKEIAANAFRVGWQRALLKLQRDADDHALDDEAVL